MNRTFLNLFQIETTFKTCTKCICQEKSLNLKFVIRYFNPLQHQGRANCSAGIPVELTAVLVFPTHRKDNLNLAIYQREVYFIKKKTYSEHTYIIG